MYQNKQLTDWHSFTKVMELRFGPSTYDNHQEELFKLRQEGSVSDYQAKFEKLRNRVLGLPTEAILNCFISGLYPDIQNELAIQKPHSISQAIGLAKLIEAKHKDTKSKILPSKLLLSTYKFQPYPSYPPQNTNNPHIHSIFFNLTTYPIQPYKITRPPSDCNPNARSQSFEIMLQL